MEDNSWIAVVLVVLLFIKLISWSDETGYNRGYKAAQEEFCNENNPYAGYDEGYKYGLDEGYTEGYDEGYDEGYVWGYDHGWEDAKGGYEYDETPVG